MLHTCDLNEISDGKIYELNDLAKLGSHECEGCHACCCGMGDSVTLDPLDVWRLEKGLAMTFQELLKNSLELHAEGDLRLPNIRMSAEEEKCIFLDEKGRCSIHSFRPGICRIFPLGRIYEDGKLKYILQVHECPHNVTKIRVRDWLDEPDLKKNQAFVQDWHDLRTAMDQYLGRTIVTWKRRHFCMQVLQICYMKPFPEGKNIYEELEERIRSVRMLMESEPVNREKNISEI